MTRTREPYLCSICRQPKKGHTCPGGPPVQTNALFKKAYEDSRKSLKEKFAALNRLALVSPSTKDVRGVERDHSTEAVPEEEVEDDEFVHKCRVEDAFDRIQQHDQMREQLCPADTDIQNEFLEDAAGDLPLFVASTDEAKVDSSADVASGAEPAHSNGSVSAVEWWFEIPW